MPIRSWCVAIFGVALVCTAAFADPPPSDADLIAQATELALKEETVEIHGDAPAESASSVHLDQDTLAERSRTQTSDLLRNVPGLVVSQHAGGGKADQYFIRGFDADHGTDIAIFADGVPVNLTSHGHGQGYADTHWLIPETVDSIDVHKGPYAARYGDFYTAGAMELKTIDQVAGPMFILSAGTPLAGPRAFDSYNRRLVGMASPKLGGDDDRSLIALQIADSDGPFVNPQDFRQGSALVKWQGKVGRGGTLRLEGNWYSARWNASGQLPESLVDAGQLDRFGSIDPTEGGIASRTSAQIAYQVRDDAGGTWHATSYVLNNQLRLWSDFTLFARDPVDGDQIEQTDARMMYGLDAGYERAIHRGGLDALITAGAQIRADDVQTGLWHDARRVRLADCFDQGTNPCNDTDNHIRDFGAFVEANVIATPWLHIFPGVRIDQFTWDVTGTIDGTAQKAIANPKLSVELHETEQVDLFANFGGGFHSNDARAAVQSMGEGALARAWGGEVGARVKPAEHAHLAMDFWYLWLSSEQVWNGDEGTTEPSAPTQRLGIDLDGSIDATPWLSLDGNVTFSHSSFVENSGNNNALALAPRWMGSGGASVHGKRGFVSLRARGIGDRPGNNTGTLVAKGYLILDLIAGRQFGKLGVNLTINNLSNSDWREAQFADSSRVSPTADVVEQMHFTPGIPLTATATLTYTY